MTNPQGRRPPAQRSHERLHECKEKSFAIVSAVIYFIVVVPMNRLQERTRKPAEPEAPKPSNEERLLGEIRDLLKRERTA